MMKRLIAAVIAAALVLACAAAGAEPVEEDWVAVPCGRDGVAEFMNAFTSVYSYADGEHCYNVTPESVAEETEFRIFKFSDSCASYVLEGGHVYDLCDGYGGYGFLNAVPWDYDGDGVTDLLVASSWGSGFHRSEISVFSGAEKRSRVIFSTMNEADAQADLAVFREGPEIILRQVDIQFPEDGDFASLRYRAGEVYQAASFVPRLPAWSEETLVPLLGTWYCLVEESGYQVGISLEFCDDGALALREIEPEILRYTEGIVQFWADGNHLVLETEYERMAYAYTVTGDELRLALLGPESLVFTRLPEEKRAWWESLQPKYRPGEVGYVKIDYGTSEHFTHEQMDAAIEAVKQRFVNWYGCELHLIAYDSDETSAREFRYYAPSQKMKTGLTYVDGMVFTSSFHTPPEDQGLPGSGFEPDTEYTGWNWILLLTEDGEWELVTWGYG